jgi:phosphoribosylglycinamide formyltransferase 1
VIGVLVSGAGTNLQALLDAGLPVVAVASSNTKAPALDRAARAGIEAGAFPTVEFESREHRDEEMAEWLSERGVELVVLAGFMQLLTAPFLDRFPGRILNVHPSLLPAFPGAHAVEDALAHGVKVTGATVHFVDEGIDTGPIVVQEAVEVRDGDTLETLHARIQEVEHRLLPHAVRLFLDGKLTHAVSA